MNKNRGTDEAINNLLQQQTLYTISVPPTEINHKISYPQVKVVLRIFNHSTGRDFPKCCLVNIYAICCEAQYASRGHVIVKR